MACSIVLRDPVQLVNLISIGERKKANGTRLLNKERDALSSLHRMSVHPMRNPTTGVPMGLISPELPNHVYRMCCDILLTFECGLMKNVYSSMGAVHMQEVVHD